MLPADAVTDWELYVGVAVYWDDGNIGVVKSASPSGQCQVAPAQETADGRIVPDPDKSLVEMVRSHPLLCAQFCRLHHSMPRVGGVYMLFSAWQP